MIRGILIKKKMMCNVITKYTEECVFFRTEYMRLITDIIPKLSGEINKFISPRNLYISHFSFFNNQFYMTLFFSHS